MSSTTKQIIYGLFALIGVCATWYFNVQLLQAPGGFSWGAFIADNYVNAASGSIANDLWVVAAVFLFWSFLEARKLGMKHWWLYFILTFLIAIAFTFPLFLLMRERKLAAG